ncbi:MAG: hypothetical protein MI975_06535 [Cytophagales bacterium]|nr:hypothetical protein [Cytophagales bacterium]
MKELKIPNAPSAIQKGVPLKMVLDKAAIQQLGENLRHVYKPFDKAAFARDALDGIEPLSITRRSEHIAVILRKHLPGTYSEAIGIMLKSLTPPLEKTEDNGLAVFFYMPHCHYIAKYGIDKKYNNDEDPFDISMHAQYELTKRFSCEFSIRPFIIKDEDRTMKVLYEWMKDANPHVRRLCSEGTRPRLPWAIRIPSFISDPSPAIPILEKLKNDPDLYVRRSVANHIGDMAKDNLKLALTLCDHWLTDASAELKWVIRHALRHPAKKGDSAALKIRKAAK